MDLVAVFLGGLGASLLASGIAYVGPRRLQNQAIRHREKGLTRAACYGIGKIGTDLQITLEAERGYALRLHVVVGRLQVEGHIAAELPREFRSSPAAPKPFLFRSGPSPV